MGIIVIGLLLFEFVIIIIICVYFSKINLSFTYTPKSIILNNLLTTTKFLFCGNCHLNLQLQKQCKNKYTYGNILNTELEYEAQPN